MMMMGRCSWWEWCLWFMVFVFLLKTNILMSLYFLGDMLQMSGSGRRLEWSVKHNVQSMSLFKNVRVFGIMSKSVMWMYIFWNRRAVILLHKTMKVLWLKMLDVHRQSVKLDGRGEVLGRRSLFRQSTVVPTRWPMASIIVDCRPWCNWIRG